MSRLKSHVSSILLLTVVALLGSAALLAQTTPTTDSSKSAELQTRLKYLALQKRIDAIDSQLEDLRKQEKATPVPRTTDEAIALTNLQIKEDDLQRQLAALKDQQQALLNPPPPVAVPVVPTPTPAPSPAPGPAPQPAPKANTNCTTQPQGPVVPKKASDWACKHLGVCPDDIKQMVKGSNPCPAGQTTTQKQ